MSNEIGQTIANQIGNRALFMMGAKHLVATKDGLHFRIGRNAKSVNCVWITLDPSDTYTLRFLRIRGNFVKEVAACSDIYCDQMHATIEAETGMPLSL